MTLGLGKNRLVSRLKKDVRAWAVCFFLGALGSSPVSIAANGSETLRLPAGKLEESGFKNANGQKILVETEATAEPDPEAPFEFENTAKASYRTRRDSTGILLSVGYSLYSPFNYTPNFAINKSFQSYYGSASSGMPELEFVYKKNFSLGSLGFGLRAGYFNAKGSGGGSTASLQVVPIHIGATYYLDALGAEPHIVPYIGGGPCTAFYNEGLKNQSVSGNSSISYFYTAGIEIQLNWFDDYGSRYSYQDYAMENAFFYVEAEGQGGGGGSGSGSSPDLSNPLYVNLGLRMEF